jgi:hypothetical protein
LTLSEDFFRRYGKLPHSVHRVTDPIVKTSIRLSESNSLKNMRSKGDRWVAKKKSRFGR